MRASTLAVVGCIAVCALPTFATDWVVGPPGSGAHFTTIQGAINEAHAGDRVFVLPGFYDGAVVVDKAIDLIGAGSGVVTVQALATTVPGIVSSPMRITGIAAGLRARVSGFTLGFLGAVSAPVLQVLLVDECPGRVELSDLKLLGATLPPLFPPDLGALLVVHNCAQVSASAIEALGFNQALPFPAPGFAAPVHGLAGVLVDHAALSMTDSTAQGNSTRPPSSGFGGDGGPGVIVKSSWLQISKSIVRGAQSAGHEDGVSGAGGHGIQAIEGIVVAHGGAGNLVAGADALEFGFLGPLELGTAGSGVALDEGSTLVSGSDTQIIGGAATATLPGASAIDAQTGAVVQAGLERLPTVSQTPATVHLGQTLTIQVSGEPGIDLVRAVTFATAPYTIFPGVLGAAVVNPSNVVVWQVDLIGPAGTMTIPVVVPSDPSLAGLEVVEQCAQALPGGIVISPPSIVTLVP